ncbi:MAG TPA: sulfur oxidation c-type cytochrome SoxA [Burkholderiales bacterium]|nr:sulfur oxidation c-type cytochrome SoxA [Burkholderiales bacterium]
MAAAFTAIAGEPQKPSPLKSGVEFTAESARALEKDEFANPGMLWVERGAKLWGDAAVGSGKSCASCHGDAAKSMKGAATRYPRVDPGAERLVDLEGRINLCREKNQRAAPLARESDELLALTAYVARQSRGMPLAVAVDEKSRAAFERGRAQYNTRVGQMNLACTHCHDRNWGRQLAAETVSQGHGNAFPAYRLEWQSIGSLERRIRACYYGVRAEMPPYGAEILLDLELYLGWRASGLPVETPGVRR